MSDLVPSIIITGEQVRGARAMLRLSQQEFAALTHVTVGTIRRMERTRGPIVTSEAVLKAMCAALEEAGIEFIGAGHYEGIGGPGIRLAGTPELVADVIDIEMAAEEVVPERPDEPKAS